MREPTQDYLVLGLFQSSQLQIVRIYQVRSPSFRDTVRKGCRRFGFGLQSFSPLGEGIVILPKIHLVLTSENI